MCQVKRRSFLGLSGTILGGGLVAGKRGHGFQNGDQGAPGSVHHHVHAVTVMTETANRFLAALSPQQRAKATFHFFISRSVNPLRSLGMKCQFMRSSSLAPTRGSWRARYWRPG
jgi:hypothetical protein